jgi:hypothetical protein
MKFKSKVEGQALSDEKIRDMFSQARDRVTDES